MKRFHRRRLSVESLETRRLLAAVDIPDDLSGAPAAIVSVPVNVDNATGIRGAEIRLSYDTQLLDLDPTAITAGSVWGNASDTQVTANVDDLNGTVVVFISASTDLSGISGSLVLLPFSIASDAVIGSTSVIDLTQVTLNEGQVPVSPSPVAGSDSTDGLLTIAGGATGTDLISGFVYADTNTNTTVDANEGIAGVTITLVDTSTNAERQTTTASDGSYQFTQLPAGSYRIVESQPIAYLDGGANELSVTLIAGQTVSDQNFREVGLLPQFIYNRLHTTLVMPVGSTAWTNTIAKINSDASSGVIASPVASSELTINSSSATALAQSEVPVDASVAAIMALNTDDDNAMQRDSSIVAAQIAVSGIADDKDEEVVDEALKTTKSFLV